MTNPLYNPSQRPPNQIRRNKAYRGREDDWIRDYLRDVRTCTVSSMWDDMPFNNPTLFWYDEESHRVIFHSNIMGRVRANIEHNPKVCISCFEMGNLLPSNAALEFSVQYEAVVIFGEAEIIQEPDAAREALYGLLAKYFPKMRAGEEFRPITDAELRQTSVYSVKISSWSGKVNDNEVTDQIEDWPQLSDEIFNGGFA
jgi:hypothetical protein